MATLGKRSYATLTVGAGQVVKFRPATSLDVFGTLIADGMVVAHLLSDLPDVEDNEFTSTPLHFIDTAGAGYDEQIEPDGESRLNEMEAALVVRQPRCLRWLHCLKRYRARFWWRRFPDLRENFGPR